MSAKDHSKNDAEPYKQLALNVGANFAQSIASETFKQTVFANAAGLAAVLAYLATIKDGPLPFFLVVAAFFFLCGLSSTLLSLQFTYAATAITLRAMLSSASKGMPFSASKLSAMYSLFGDILRWGGVVGFIMGSGIGAYGMFTVHLIRVAQTGGT